MVGGVGNAVRGDFEVIEMTLIWIAGAVAAASLVMALGAMFIGAIAYRPRELGEEVSDVLILSAHQDDCVIMAGEYAIAAKEAGKNVKVVYLTNGDSVETQPDSTRAQKRNQEALAAWESQRVGAESIYFLGLPAAPVLGPSKISEKQSQQAGERVGESIAALPQGAAVFIPGPGESHVDHQTLRHVALGQLQKAGRTDVRVFESVEYNPCLSLMRMPRKTLLYIASVVPVLGRWAIAARREQLAPEEFPCGGPALVMPEKNGLLKRKRSLLSMFASENGELLVRIFGGRGRFRRIDDLAAAIKERPRGFLKLGPHWLGPSALAGLVFLYAVGFLLTAGVARAMVQLGTSKLLLAASSAAVAAGFAWLCVLKVREAHRRLFFISVVIGFFAGGWLTR